MTSSGSTPVHAGAFQPGRPVFLNESLVRLRVEPFHVQEDGEAPHGRERLAAAG